MYAMFKNIPEEVRCRLREAEFMATETGTVHPARRAPLRIPEGAPGALGLAPRSACCPIGYLMLSTGVDDPWPTDDRVVSWLLFHGWEASGAMVRAFLNSFDAGRINTKEKLLAAAGCKEE